jgi:tetratricopeptide (TPR) repeat protein
VTSFRSTVLISAVAVGTACSTQPASESITQRAPLYDDLGSYHRPITTSSADAQKYFDQGLALSYGFNHAEAIRAFKHAAALDQACAMCYWGVAYALGPNINAPITEDAAKEAWDYIGRARQASGASAVERALIEALAKRYTADPKADRPPLDAAYGDAMREVVRQYPDDLDAATLFAQALMDTSPWNYWELDGRARPLTAEVIASLESVIARNANHAGAIHLYIHAVEASPDPKRAEAHADRLAALMPGAGHIVHMPAHIYLRTGRFGDASRSNDDAVKADEAYFAGDDVDGNMMYQVGYYPHNIHFKATSAAFEGRRAAAMESAEAAKARMHADMLKDPAMGGMVQHFMLTPLYMMVRFASYDRILEEPEPEATLPYMRAIRHLARGLAHLAANRPADAAKERAALAALKDEPSLKTTFVSSVNTASSIVAIADAVLQGEIAVKARRTDEAVRHFAQAVALEDGLTYMEPPDWPIPVRELQGASLLELGRARDAEQAFLDDLKKFPENGWSLSGLQASLERQGRSKEAARIKARLDAAWRAADVTLVAGRAR